MSSPNPNEPQPRDIAMEQALPEQVEQLEDESTPDTEQQDDRD